MNKLGHVEIFHNDGVRQISQDFRFIEGNQFVSITCFAPFIHSQNWGNVTRRSYVECELLFFYLKKWYTHEHVSTLFVS